MRNLAKGIKTTFGVVGLLTAMYWALLHAGFGLIGQVFGQEILDWVNLKMSLFNAIIPYVVFIIAFASGCIWLGYSIYSWVKKIKRKREQEDLTREEVIEKITELLMKVIELLPKLK